MGRHDHANVAPAERRLGWSLVILAAIAEATYVGVALLSAEFAYDRPGATRPLIAVFTLLAVAFGVHLLALRQALQLPRSWQWVWIVIVPAVLFRATMVLSLPIQEVDIYRYLWDGAVAISGVNPYRYSPNQVAAARLDRGGRPEDVPQEVLPQEDLPDDLRQLADQCRADPALATILDRVHFAELPTIYPPVSQVVFAAVAAVTPRAATVYHRVVIMKVALTLFDLATLAVLLQLLRITGYHWGWSIVYAWCPLAMKEIAGSGHLDAIAVSLTTLAVAIACRSLRAGDHPGMTPPPDEEDPPARAAVLSAAVVLALAVGAKLYPIVLAPWLLVLSIRRAGPRWGIVAAGGFIVLTAILMLPMLPHRPAVPAADVPVVDSHNLPPLPQNASPFTPQDPSAGLAAFLHRWEMNDLLFMIVVENLKPTAPRPNAVPPWFSVVPEPWRQALLQPVAAKLGIDAKAAAFLITRVLTLGLFAAIALTLLFTAYRDGRPVAYLRVAFLTIAWFWLLAPTQNPWYWLWALPLLPFARSRAWLLVSGLLLVYYLRFWLDYHWPAPASAAFGYSGTQLFDFVITWLEFAPWLVYLAVDYRRS